jgi:hypothetical protein
MRLLLALPLDLKRSPLNTLIVTLSNIVLTEFELIIIMIIVESMSLTADMIARLVEKIV